jgi:hypothetical protein
MEKTASENRFDLRNTLSEWATKEQREEISKIVQVAAKDAIDVLAARQ